jgi:hypothetical protein
VKLWQRMLGADEHEMRSIGMDDWIAWNGHQYPLGLPQTIHGDKEPPPTSYEAYATQMLAANPVVWSAVDKRKAVFSQIRYRYRRLSTGEMFGRDGLRILDEPYPGGDLHKLLVKMIIHADCGGNAYPLRVPGTDRVSLMRPDYVTIILGSQLRKDDPYLAEDAELVGYMYTPPGGKPALYFPDEAGHLSFMPDPLATFRGMSWMTPVVRDVMGDKLMSEHKLKFFEQGATPNMIIKFDVSQTMAQVKAFKELAEENSRGVLDAYRTLYLGGGADATLVGANLQQLDFAQTVGKAETRILMAAGVHAAMAGASEGMEGSALNAGNFKSVSRMFSDVHLQDMWLSGATALAPLVPREPGAVLAPDDEHIKFLQDDAKDQAEIQFTQARAITLYVREGFKWESAVRATKTNDVNQLEHSGLMSVQLQPAVDPNADPDAAPDGEPETDPAAGDGTETEDGIDKAARRAAVAQKSYLAVGVSMTAEENRRLLREAGIPLDESLPDELKPKDPEPPAPVGDPAANPFDQPPAADSEPDQEGDGDDDND